MNDKLKTIIVAVPTGMNQLTLSAELFQPGGQPVTGTGVDYIFSEINYVWTRNGTFLGNTQSILINSQLFCPSNYQVEVTFVIESIVVSNPNYTVLIGDTVCGDITFSSMINTCVIITGDVEGSIIVTNGIGEGKLEIIGRVQNQSLFTGNIAAAGFLINGIPGNDIAGANILISDGTIIDGTVENYREMGIAAGAIVTVNGSLTNEGTFIIEEFLMNQRIAIANIRSTLRLIGGLFRNRNRGRVIARNNAAISAINNSRIELSGESIVNTQINTEVLISTGSQLVINDSATIATGTDSVVLIDNATATVIGFASMDVGGTLMNMNSQISLMGSADADAVPLVQVNNYDATQGSILMTNASSNGVISVIGSMENSGSILLDSGSINITGDATANLNSGSQLEINGTATLNVSTGGSVNLIGGDALLTNRNQLVVYPDSMVNVANGQLVNERTLGLLGSGCLDVASAGGFVGNVPVGNGQTAGIGAPPAPNNTTLVVSGTVVSKSGVNSGIYADTTCFGSSAGTFTDISADSANFQPFGMDASLLDVISAPVGNPTGLVLISTNDTSILLNNPNQIQVADPVLSITLFKTNVLSSSFLPSSSLSLSSMMRISNVVTDSILVNNRIIRSDSLLSSSVVNGQVKITLRTDLYTNVSDVKWAYNYKSIKNLNGNMLIAAKNGIYESSFQSNGYTYVSLIEITNAKPIFYVRLRGDNGQLYGCFTGIPSFVKRLFIEPVGESPYFLYKVYFDEVVVCLRNEISLKNARDKEIQVLVTDCCGTVAFAKTFTLSCDVV